MSGLSKSLLESSPRLIDQLIEHLGHAAELAEEVGAVDLHIELCEMLDDAKENRDEFF